MTEERIHEAAETILRAASVVITRGILYTIADEARQEGIEEARKIAGDAMFSSGKRIELNGERYIKARDAERIARGYPVG